VTVNPDLPTPLYQQVAAILRDRIESGKLTARVPSAKTIMQEFGVAQGTAERALAVLRDAGLITVVIGRGGFVVPAEDRPATP
jgi:DNA-binding GntR family transcriptional regulator